jgi:putative sigma-54 modulation protein
MQIELKGRNVQVTDELREFVERRFAKMAKQVSELAVLELEIAEEHNPANPAKHCVSAALRLKGATLCAKDADRDLRHAINLCEEELSRQVVRLRAKRRKRREARSIRTADALGEGGLPAV